MPRIVIRDVDATLPAKLRARAAKRLAGRRFSDGAVLIRRDRTRERRDGRRAVIDWRRSSPRRDIA